MPRPAVSLSKLRQKINTVNYSARVEGTVYFMRQYYTENVIKK